MVNFLLPQLNAQGPDMAGSFMQGMQIPYAFQRMQGLNKSMNAEMEKRKAIKVYAETGDINALKGAPETYIQMKSMENKERQQDLGLQKLGLEIAKQSVPFLLANPTPENYQDFANTMTSKYKIPASYFPPLKTPEEITTHITKLQEMALKPSERQALLPKAPEVKEMFDPQTGLKQKMQFNKTTGGWEPFGGLAKETESQKGEFNRLFEFHQRIRPGIEPTEESLQDLFNKFNRRGLNLNNDVNFQATKQASISLSRNVEFNTLDPSNPKDATKREKMLIDETTRLKRGMTGQGGKSTQTYQVYDKTTGQMVIVTQEQYNQIKALEEQK